MKRLVDWLRFRGWRNVYWREDAAMSRCAHAVRWYDPEVGDSICVECGALVESRSPFSVTSTGANSVTVRTHVWLRF